MSVQKEGFTLIELLIVVAIIVILVVVIFIILNPLLRFQYARDSRRYQEMSEMLHTIKVDQIDRHGIYSNAIEQMAEDTVYMIGTCVAGATDAEIIDYCDSAPDADHCVNFVEYVVDGELGALPVAPYGSKEWTSEFSGYTLEKNEKGVVIIRSCESEQGDHIMLLR